MQKMKVPTRFGILLFLAFFLTSITSTQPLLAQAPAAGASVSVRMIEAVDSSKDPAGKRYRASVTKAVDAGNGAIIPQGAAALVTLVNSGNGSGWTTQLVSVTINGQPVAVTSSPASVTSAAQNAASSALGAMSSMLGGFGHHVKPPSGVTAAATGQRVVLPPGAALNFVLNQPSAAGSAAPSAVAASGAPTPQPATAAAPGPSQAPSSEAATAFYCLTALTAQNTIYYSPVEHRGQASTQAEIENAFGAFLQKTYGIRVSITCTPTSTSSQNESDRQQKIADYRTRYKVVETSWVYTPAGGPVASATASTAASSGGSFIFCSTSASVGINTYFTGVFQTTRIRPSRPMGTYIVDESIPKNFYAYLTQKGYKFKPRDPGCVVNVRWTEAEAKAAKHATEYGGPGYLGENCCGFGKIVETGWKE